jgi:pyruvate dehydrogenase E1 component beta subunit
MCCSRARSRRFVYPAFSQIVGHLAKMRARTLGAVALPVVIRIPISGGIGAVEHHSKSNEAYFAHTAGLGVVCCSNPLDAARGDRLRRPGDLL